MKRKLKASSVFLGLALVFISSCEQKCQKLSFFDFENTNGMNPPIFISKSIDDCNYAVNVNLQFVENYISEQGKLRLSRDKYLMSISTSKESIIVFDLSQEKGISNELNFGNDYPKIESVLEDIIIKNGLKVFKFRWKNSEYYEGFFFDIVWFVTKENFVIGSYVSKLDSSGDGERYASPTGDILDDVIDYSSKTLRILH